MAKKKFAIFDLDQTLVDSRITAQARKDRDWPTALSLVSQIQIYQGVPELLANLRRANYKIAFLTNSPRKYLDAVCKQFALTPDATVCFHDVARPKPHRHGVFLAVALLNGFQGDGTRLLAVSDFLKSFPQWRNESIVVGDSWVDALAARRAYVDSIGAAWGADDQKELLLSGVTYWAENVAQIQDQLVRLSQNSGPLQPDQTNAAAAFAQNLWTSVVNTRGSDFRHNLREGQEYHYARHRWKGNFSVSYGNDLISDFKNVNPDLKWAKDIIVTKFAQELRDFLPTDAQIVFIRSSKLPTDPEYDNRFELLEEALKKIRPDVSIFWPISSTKSKAAANKSDDPSLRDPSEIVKDLRWTSDFHFSGKVYIVDDVMTTGGHLEAYIRMFEQNAPDVSPVGVFWTLHMGDR